MKIIVYLYQGGADMNLFCKKIILVMFIAMLVLPLSGCGETVHGVSKDVKRMGKGVKTIFIRDSE